MIKEYTVKLLTEEIEDIIQYLEYGELGYGGERGYGNDYETDYNREQSIIKKLEKIIGIQSEELNHEH